MYDSLLLLSVAFLATALLLPFSRGEAIAAGSVLFKLYLLAVAFLFYGWFWTHGGQTLGMRAWRIRLIREDGRHLGWTDAIVRFVCGISLLAPMAIGLVFWTQPEARLPVVILGLLPPLVAFSWIPFGRKGLAWHDLASKTRMIRLPKEISARQP